MPRKHPSSHSAEQFALFVDRFRSDTKIDQNRFTQLVVDLVHVDLCAAEAVETVSPAIGLCAQVEVAPTIQTDYSRLATKLADLWSNTQSLLIRLLELVLSTDSPSAVVVFWALGNTGRRLDLIRRLAMLKIGNRQMREEIGRITDGFEDAGDWCDDFIYSPRASIEQPGLSLLASNDTGVEHPKERQIMAGNSADDILIACERVGSLTSALENLIPMLKREISTFGQSAAAD